MSAGHNGRRGRLLTTVAGGFALALAATTGAAYAQETEVEEDTIIVTGIRASLRSSTETKRGADAIVEAVTAEDIGRLPDNSITESLARLPGLTTQRLFGRGQVISVRGLAPDFATGLLNGREQVSAGDNRGVEFDQYPSELLTQVVVYKTPTGNLMGAGLAGTADLRTVRPLAYDEPVLALGARYEMNDMGALVAGTDEDGYRLTGSYIDQNDAGTVGWAIGVASMSSPTQAERWEAWGYANLNFDPSQPLVVGGAKPYVQSSLLERDGFLGVVEIEPNNAFHSRLDVFYSEFNETQDLKGIEFPLFFDCMSGCGWRLQPGFTVSNGLISSGVFQTEGVVRNDIRTRESTVTSIGWNTEWELSDQWTATADVSYSHVERNDLDLETYAGTGPGNGAGAAGGVDDNLGFQTGNGSFVFSSTLDYADPALIMLTDPQGWGQAGFIKEPQTDDELTALRLSAERQLGGAFESVEFGYNLSERTKDHTSIEAFIDLDCGVNPDNSCSVPVPTAVRRGSTALGFLGIPGMLTYDPVALFNTPGIYNIRPHTGADVVSKTWGVEETVATYYAQLNIDADWGVSVTGNLGLQIVDTDQSSTGAVRVPGPVPASVVVEQGDSYVEALPSANLSFQVGDNSFLRVAAARTLARARMDQMRASFDVSHNPSQFNNPNPTSGASYWGGFGGNPALRPWIANTFDISFEHYLGDSDGHIAIAAFYKDLESYIFSQTIPYDFTGFPLHDGAVGQPATRQGFASSFQNGSGGYIQGLEFTANIPADIFVDALEGFGVAFNASFNDSSIRPPDTPGNALPGLSETVINTTVYYESGGFEARVSNRYRDDFLGEVTGFGAGRELRFIQAESILDAQVGYRFENGPLDGLAVQFQANNITDEPFQGFSNNDPRLVRDYQRYGTTYLLGLTYRR